MPLSPTISILMPVKNTGSFLKPCLDSILAQTETNWELLAIDDHSTDESFQTLQQYSLLDTRITVHKNNGSGIIHALRLAHSFATGQYITRMDSDDIMKPTKLFELKLALEIKGRGYVAVGGVEYFNADGLGDGYKKYAEWLNGLTNNSANFSEIYKECVIPSPCWMIHQEDLEACGGFVPNVYPEDYDLCFRFYQAGFNIAGVESILHLWRDYPHRTSRTHEHYADNRFLDLKINYFISLDYIETNQLILWGVGKKGKLIAQRLIQHDIEFTWITNNTKKIGKNIYNKIIKSSIKYPFCPNDQVVLAVANPIQQAEICELLNNDYTSTKLVLFC